MSSMARRFAISAELMKVQINGQRLNRFEMPVQFQFPRDASPNGVVVDDDGWGVEEVSGGGQVRWWVGFTEKPLEDESHRGISVLARGKMAQRPFQFVKAQGTEGQLGQEYLVGEVEADWIDSGKDVDDDLIQSNRDSLQLEDSRLETFLDWGRKRLSWALRRRNVLRQDAALSAFDESHGVQELLADFTPSEQKSLRRVAAAISKIDEVGASDVETLMQEVLTARSDVVVRRMLETIEQEEGFVQTRIWGLVREFGLIDARRTKSLIEARLGTIKKLSNAIAQGASEVPELHGLVRDDPWLIDPRWDLYDDEVRIERFNIGYEPEQDEDGQQLDFLNCASAQPTRQD